MSLPSQVSASGLRWNVREHEGLIVFTHADGLALGAFSDRVTFDGPNDDGGWSVSVQGHDARINVGSLIRLYRIVEAEYGGPYGRPLTADGRIGAAGTETHDWKPGGRV